jgi:excisionase family DNA binding protein
MNATNETSSPGSGAGRDQQPRDYETKKQLAQRLGISERTVCNLMLRGLPHLKLTRKLTRFPRVAVDEWLADRQIRHA